MLRGFYLYGDYCSGEIFGLKPSAGGSPTADPDVLVKSGFRISSFGEDEAGELYVVDHRGGVYGIVAEGAHP
jgi:hypothetical protein